MKAYLLCIFLLLFKADAANNVVATVNGAPIVKQEIQREMLRYRAEVFGQYHSKRMDLLQDKAMEAMVTLKVQDQQLKQYHLWPYANYQSLLADMDRTNHSRAIMVNNKQPVYGPVAYTETDFFDYQFSNAIIKLKRKLRLTDTKYNAVVKRLVAQADTRVNKIALANISI